MIMDPLDEMEKQIADRSGNGDNHPGASAAIANEPRASVGDGATLKAQAMAGLPAEWRERLIKDAGVAGVRHDNDVGWLLVGSVVQSAAAAFAAGAAAKEVQEGVGKIQGQIFTGAIKAGESIRKDIVSGIDKKMTEGGKAIVAAIGIAAKAGSKAIEAGSKELISKLDAAVEAKKAEGVSAFAAAASEAAVAASTAAARQVISENKIKLRRSALGMAVIFLIYALIGGGIAVEYLLITHRIAPHALVMTASGKPNCGEVTIGGAVQEVCQIR